MAGTRRLSVTLSYAQSLDGSIAARAGQPLALSGQESLAFTHRLRARHDAILVGIGTVLADDPRLNVRLAEGRDPRPVVVDSLLRTPPAARLFRDGAARPIIAAVEAAPAAAERALAGAGAEVWRLPARPSETGAPLVDLERLLGRLAGLGVGSVMVEGGARIIAAFLRGRLADRVAITVCPRFVGGLSPAAGLAALGGAGLPRLRKPAWELAGDDMIVSGELEWPPA
jgi:3,4-dihydroxy 2-butanone 4-phosphate synthase/GTP cyclohydrolase II